MRKTKFPGGGSLYTIKDVEELSVELVADAESWLDRVYVLEIHDTHGREFRFELDGLHVKDFCEDAALGGAADTPLFERAEYRPPITPTYLWPEGVRRATDDSSEAD